MSEENTTAVDESQEENTRFTLDRFELPNRLVKDEETATTTYAKFTAEPFERGYGHTIGNSLRRVLLSSLEGAAITSVKITGVQHEFGSLPGVIEDVTDIVFTHAHPDHLWGLLDDFDDPLFPDASYMIGKTEWDYWLNPNTVDEIGEARASFAVGALRRLEMIEDQIEFFSDGDGEPLGVAKSSSHSAADAFLESEGI